MLRFIRLHASCQLLHTRKHFDKASLRFQGRRFQPTNSQVAERRKGEFLICKIQFRSLATHLNWPFLRDQNRFTLLGDFAVQWAPPAPARVTTFYDFFQQWYFMTGIAKSDGNVTIQKDDFSITSIVWSSSPLFVENMFRNSPQLCKKVLSAYKSDLEFFARHLSRNMESIEALKKLVSSKRQIMITNLGFILNTYFFVMDDNYFKTYLQTRWHFFILCKQHFNTAIYSWSGVPCFCVCQAICFHDIFPKGG